MNTVPPSLDQTSQLHRVGRYGALVIACLFVLCVLLQVFLAGGGIFAAPAWWPMHKAFGMMISLLPLALLLLAWPGKLGRRALWFSALAFVLIGLQPVFITLPGKLDLPVLSALHPVNALIIFGLAVWLMQRAWQGVRGIRLAA